MNEAFSEVHWPEENAGPHLQRGEAGPISRTWEETVEAEQILIISSAVKVVGVEYELAMAREVAGEPRELHA